MKTKAAYSLCLLVVSMLFSCRTAKETASLPQPIIITNTDSVRIEYIETITIDTVRVEVPVPIESAKQVVPDSTSFLETSLAQSYAWINPDGTLGHSISNKPQRINADVLVPQINKSHEKESIKEKEIPIPTPYPVEVERQWTRMEQIKLASFWYLVGVVLMSIGYIFRKQIWKFLKRTIVKC